MRGLKFIVAWESIILLLVLKLALLAGWIGNVINDDFSRYAQLWFAIPFAIVNVIFSITIVSCLPDREWPWQERKNGSPDAWGRMRGGTMEDREGWF